MWLPPLLLSLASLTTAVPTPDDCHATAFIGTAYRDRSGTDYSLKAEIAAYADGYALPATGELVRAGDGFADMGCSLPWKRPFAGPWIALVRRGGCSVELKIANAVIQGANGLIIYNNRDSLSLQNLRVTRKYQSLISVVFTYKWKGEELTTLLDFGTQIVAELSVANPCIAINHDYERNMQLVSISFLCFIVLTISLAWLIFYYVQRYRDVLARERKSRGYSEADEKALKSIPTKTLKSNDKLLKDESECCAICIDPYRPLEVVRTLVCNHEFHKDCIDPWLLENRTCPMCKKDILNHYGSVFLGSQESIVQVMASEAHQRLAGPSSPAVQVVVVSHRSPARSRLAPPVSSDTGILTERIQPTNTDAMSFVGSCSSLLTVDSAQEALHLIDSAQETSKTACMTSQTNLRTSTCAQGCNCCPQTSKSGQITSRASHVVPNLAKNQSLPGASETAQVTSEYLPTSANVTDASKTSLRTSNSPQEISLLDSCLELRETPESNGTTETQAISVDKNGSPDASDVLLEKSSNLSQPSDTEHS